ncbi:unnamed protein product, partial [Laminaria digitata]
QVAGSLLLTDRGAETLADSCPRLTHVDLSGCPGVTSNSLAYLLAKCPALRVVKAWGIRVAGSLAGVCHDVTTTPIYSAAAAASSSGSSSGSSSLASCAATAAAAAAAALALRRAYLARGVELAWAGPLPLPP